MTTTRTNPVFAALLIAVLALTAALYAPITTFDFVGYDDPEYVVYNARVHDGLQWSTVAWAARSFECSNWHPLTWLSHALDWQLFGRSAGGHHATSLVLHLLAIALVFAAIRRLTGSPAIALWTAAVFALHPLNVESVAWVAERKNVLSGLFFAATVWAYACHAARPRVGTYALVTLLFALGLAAKPSLVPLPLLLLALDVWPLDRLERLRSSLGGTRPAVVRLVVEKLPWLFLSVVDSLLTLKAQAAGMATIAPSTLVSRAGVALAGYWSYLSKLAWPDPIAVFYPMPSARYGSLPVLTASVVVGAVSIAAFLGARRRPFVVVGWLWFLLMLGPVIGVVAIGQQFIADRYVYTPMLGLLLILGYGATELVAARPALRLWIGAVAAAVVVALAVRTHGTIGYWRDSLTLYGHAIEVVPGNHLALRNMAVIYGQRGDRNRALDSYLKAIDARPEVDSSHEIGALLAEAGRIDEALPHLRAAVAAAPGSARARYNLGLAFWLKGRNAEARLAILAALALTPEDRGLRDFLGQIDARIRSAPVPVPVPAP